MLLCSNAVTGLLSRNSIVNTLNDDKHTVTGMLDCVGLIGQEALS